MKSYYFSQLLKFLIGQKLKGDDRNLGELSEDIVKIHK